MRRRPACLALAAALSLPAWPVRPAESLLVGSGGNGGTGLAGSLTGGGGGGGIGGGGAGGHSHGGGAGGGLAPGGDGLPGPGGSSGGAGGVGSGGGGSGVGGGGGGVSTANWLAGGGGGALGAGGGAGGEASGGGEAGEHGGSIVDVDGVPFAGTAGAGARAAATGIINGGSRNYEYIGVGGGGGGAGGGRGGDAGMAGSLHLSDTTIVADRSVLVGGAGGGSTLVTQGGAGGAGTLVLSNGALLQVGDTLLVGGSGGGGTADADGNRLLAGGAGGAGTLTMESDSAAVLVGGRLLVGGGEGGGDGVFNLGRGTVTFAPGAEFHIRSNGTLNIGDGTPANMPGGSLAALEGSIANDGEIHFYTSGAYTMATPIAGSGSVTVTAGGSIRFVADHTYTGGTTISPGSVLYLGMGGDAGAVVGDIANDGGLVFDRIGTVTYDGDVTGAGSFAKMGAGTLILTGDHSTTGTIGIYGGTLELSGAAARLGSASSDLTVGQTPAGPSVSLSVSAGARLTTSLVLLGNVQPATVSVSGAGSSLDSGGSIVVGQFARGQLEVSDGATVRAGDVRMGSSSADASILLWGDDVQGRGTLAAGWLSRDAAADIVTIDVDGGILQARADEGDFLRGFGLGEVTIGANGLHIDTNGHAVGVAAALDGSGALNKVGAGTLTLGSTGNVYSGGTRVAAGTLAAGAAGVLGSGGLEIGAGARADLAGYDQAVASLAGAGDLLLGGATLTVGSDDTSTTYSGAIGGTGGLVKQGTGTLTLAGTSAYSGPTRVDAGMLRVDGDIGSSAVTVDNGASLGGTGTVGSTTVLAGGRLAPGNSVGSLFVDGNFTLATGAVLDYELGAPGAGASAPGASDRLRVSGNAVLDGMLDLGDPDDEAGLGYYRLISYDGLLSGSGLHLGNLPAGYTAGQIRILTDVPGHVDLRIGAAGSDLLQAWSGGSGTWDAAGAQWTNDGGDLPTAWAGNHGVFATAGGGDVTVQGTHGFAGLQFVADGYRLLGPGALRTDAGGSELRVLGGATAVVDAAIGGAGGVAKTQGGTLVLGGTNTYLGGTRVLGGVLEVGRDANLGAAGGGLELNGGALRIANAAYASTARAVTLGAAGGVFDVPHDFTVQGDIGGPGALYKDGAGTLRLAGAGRYGATHVRAGTLVGDARAIAGDIANAGTVVFDQADDAGYGGRLSGAGGLSKRGAGTLALTGDSSAYAGATVVAAGRLAVDGRLGGTLEVRSGAELGGTGTVGTTTVQAGAVHAPGNSIGTQTVAGDYANRGTLRIEATPSGHDGLVVAGAVDIAGAVLDLRLSPDDAAGWDPGAGPYTLIDKRSTGAIQGSFARVDNPLLFLDAAVSSTGGDGNDLTLALTRRADSGSPGFDRVAATRNQRAVARAIDALPQGHEVWKAVALSADAAALQRGLEALSGDMHAGVSSALLAAAPAAPQAGLARLQGNLSAGMLPGAPTAAAGGAWGASDAPGAAAALPRPAAQPVWAQFSGDWRRMDGDGNAPALSYQRSGLTAGGDRAVGGGWRVGAALGYGDGRLQAGSRNASADTDSYTAALYAGKGYALGPGRLKVAGGVAYTWHDVRTRRRVQYGSLGQQLEADYHASATQVFAELGYAVPVAGDAAVEPFAGLAWSDLRTRGFGESGGSAALSAGSQSQKLATSMLGLRGQWRAPAPGRDLVLRASLGWRHAYGEVRPKTTMAFDQGPSFTVAGTPIARDAARVELGADLLVVRGVTAGLSYAGEFGGGNRQHAGMLDLRWRF